jgi:PAS domain S-box-containing protein
MNRALNFLIVEDSQADYLVTLRVLREAGLAVVPRRVDRLAELRLALAEPGWDAVISDYSVPGLAFRDTLAAVRQADLDLPVVLFSGTIGEEEAIALVKLGVRDYVWKDRAARLPSALRNAMEEARNRRFERAAAAALAASEARFQAIFEQAAVGISQVALDGRVLSANRRICEILGYSREELLNLNRAELNPPDQRVASEEHVRRLCAGEYATFKEEKLNVRGDGSTIWVSLSSSLVRDAQGEPAYLIVVMEDISARKRADAALRSSEERFSAIFRASPIAILLTRMEDQVILDANPAFLELLGYDLAQLRGATMDQLGLWDQPEALRQAREQIRRSGSLKALPMTFRRRSGEAGHALASGETVQLGGSQVMVGILQDVTELHAARDKERRMERELGHLQRLESLGRLVGGVSHDMNNVLAAIMAMASVLEARSGHHPETARSAGAILQASIRGRDLVQGLTAFARKEQRPAVALNLNQLVRQEADLLERTTFKKLAIQLHLEEPLPAVLAEASALANALMNLCVNACDAMPGGGTLRLETRRLEGGMVELAVEDTGAGMTPEVAARAMEPFFTTKPEGRGTGLGLALVAATAQAHGGRVNLRSAPGKGTRVEMVLPQLAAQAPAAPAPAVAGQGVGRSLRVLLVDDDALIRETVPPLLEHMGHRTQAAAGGLEALGLLEAGLDFDLAILDVSMPGMDGIETLGRLRVLRPGLPVLLATGFVDERMPGVLSRFPNVRMLRKPFLISDLGEGLAGF